MEASSFLSFNKTLDLVPSSRLLSSSIAARKKRFGQCLQGTGSGHPHSTAILCCSPGSQLPSDDHEPVIESDWRSFRARLVAREKASDLTSLTASSLAPCALGDKWAHLIHEPEKGCLLVSTEKLDRGHKQAVLLLLSDGPRELTGIILNWRPLMSINENLPTNFNINGIFSGRPLFYGGPITEGIFLVVPQKEDENDGVGKSGAFEEVMKGLYYGTKESVVCAAEMVKRNVVGLEDFSFFMGYCGWNKEQMRQEIKDGYWNVVACSPSVVGRAIVARTNIGLWDEVVGLVGQR